jgi:ribosomal protein S26
LEKELLSEQMSIIVGENFLISVEEKTNTAIQKIIDWIKSSRGIIRRMGIDYLLYLIIDEVINGYFLVLEEIEDGLEELEDELTTNPTSSTLQAIHRFKRQLLQFNKNTWPLREVIGTLGRTGHRFIDNQTIHFLDGCFNCLGGTAGLPYKRKNRGRRKGDKGSEPTVQCDNCGAFVPRSKIQRITTRVSLVRGDLARELKQMGAYIAENVVVKNLCISCAIHYGVLKVRAREERKQKQFL